jgi:hypothetical protein
MCATYTVKQYQQHVLISVPTAVSHTVEQFFIDKYRAAQVLFRGSEFAGPEIGFPRSPLNIFQARKCFKCKQYNLMEPLFYTGK